MSASGTDTSAQGKAALKERFIELRAEGRSYADIAGQLNVSKTTLIAWARELSREIANARTMRLDELFERFAVAKTKRIEAFGQRLQGILDELDKRKLSEVKTEALLSLALKYGAAMRSEQAPLLLQGDDEEPSISAAFYTRPSWPA